MTSMNRTDDAVRRWAAEQLGWYYNELTGRIGIPDKDDGSGNPIYVNWKSNADLAETMRLHLVQDWFSDDLIWLKRHSLNEHKKLRNAWFWEGPMAFLHTLKEICT